MNVSLTPQLEKFIQEKVNSGRYSTASEVVREGLRLLERRERWLSTEELKEELRVAIEQADAGKGESYKTVIDRIKQGLASKVGEDKK